MKSKFLVGVGHQSRAIIFMVGSLVFYCFWLWLLMALGIISNETSTYFAAFLLLIPLMPVAGFDLWMRITWQQEQPTLYPPPPKLSERLLEREYGLYWFPVIICIPLWIWGTALAGWVLSEWIKT